MTGNSLVKLPQELKDHIGRYLNLRSIARAQLASKGIKFSLSSERAKQARHSRVWRSVCLDENFQQRAARKHGGNAEDYDMVLLGSDLEFLYHADDEQKKPPQDYGPLHLFMCIIKRDDDSGHIYPHDLHRGLEDTRIVIHTSSRDDKNTVSDVWNLGITWTWAVFRKFNLDLNMINVDAELKSGQWVNNTHCLSTFRLNQVPGSRFPSIEIRGGMPKKILHPYPHEDDQVTSHLKQMIGTLHRMARQNLLNEPK